MDGLSSIPQSRGGFGKLFQWAATVDQTPYLCVPEALKFRAEICGGEDKIRRYCFGLARKGGLLVADILGTEPMQHPQSELRECCLPTFAFLYCLQL